MQLKSLAPLLTVGMDKSNSLLSLMLRLVRFYCIVLLQQLTAATTTQETDTPRNEPNQILRSGPVTSSPVGVKKELLGVCVCRELVGAGEEQRGLQG